MATAIVGGKKNIILLDEPAQNLHPIMQSLVFRKITEKLKESESQAFIITHSPQMLSSSIYYLSPSENISDRHDKSSENEVLSLSTEKKEELKVSIWYARGTEKGTQYLNVEKELLQLMTYTDEPNHLMIRRFAEFASLFFARGVVFVEGPTDKIVISLVNGRLSEEAGKENWSRHNVEVITAGGKTNFKPLELCEDLGIPYVVLSDCDALMECTQSSNIGQIPVIFSFLIQEKKINDEAVKQLADSCRQVKLETSKTAFYLGSEKWDEAQNYAKDINFFVFPTDIEGMVLLPLDKLAKPMENFYKWCKYKYYKDEYAGNKDILKELEDMSLDDIKKRFCEMEDYVEKKLINKIN